MTFDASFLDDLPSDVNAAIVAIADNFLSYFGDNHTKKPSDLMLMEYIKALAILEAYLSTNGIDKPSPEIDFNNTGESVTKIYGYFRSIRNQAKNAHLHATREKFKEIFKNKIETGFVYEFSDDDLERIQKLINELRDIIKDTSELEEKHRARLLRKLERFQAELHKTVSDLDRFWGFLIDASFVLKKIGENAKPIVDRVGEIMNIIWRTQVAAEQIEMDTPLRLPKIDED